MRTLRRTLQSHIALWDTPTRVALVLALLLLLLLLGIVQWGGESLRLPATIGLVTLLFVMQGLVLWGNRRLVTPFTQAQRAYLQGDFDNVIRLLEGIRGVGKADVQELTLLGNTYRQIGDLSTSAVVLYEALHITPLGHFPLYGFGRTLLAKGEYTEAARHLRLALANGAPKSINVELSEVLYRLGDRDAAIQALREIPTTHQLEPYRALMCAYLGVVLGVQPIQPLTNYRSGLIYWEQAAQRFSHTPYGVELIADVSRLKALIEGDTPTHVFNTR